MLSESLSAARNRAVLAVESVPAWAVVLSTAAVVGATAAVFAAVALSRPTAGVTEVPSEEVSADD
jgi:hypothetical protein